MKTPASAKVLLMLLSVWQNMQEIAIQKKLLNVSPLFQAMVELLW